MAVVLVFLALTIILIGGGLVTVMTSQSLQRQAHRQLHALLAEVARKFGGQHVDPDSNFRSRVVIQHGKHSIVARVRTEGPAVYVLETEWDVDPKLYWEVRDTNPTALFFTGEKQIEVDQEDFNSRFTVVGNDDSATRSLLNNAVFEEFRRFASGYSFGQVQLRMRSGKLSFVFLDTHEFGPRADVFIQVVQGFLNIVDHLGSEQAEGIEINFISSEQIADLTDPERDVVCQICGCEIAQEVVYCSTCQTPHHRDCWEYNGACSTYGCQEKSFKRHLART